VRGSTWLTRSVIGFGVASFLSDLGHEAATAALPALLAAIGGAPAALGIIEGVSDGLSSAAKLAGGWLADEPRLRKPLAVGGYLVTGLSTGIFGLASGWLLVQAVRAVGWTARGLRGPRATPCWRTLWLPRRAVARSGSIARWIRRGRRWVPLWLRSWSR
jgi:hypothetical protein